MRWVLPLLLISGCMFSMPGRSFDGPLPALSADQAVLAQRLEAHVRVLSEDIGDRTWYRHKHLVEARDYLHGELETAGYEVELQTFQVQKSGRNKRCDNLLVVVPGRTDEVVVVGAHYDSAAGVPGANDNGSGTAAVVELATLFADRELDRTVHFVLFTNEEMPWFKTEAMGSWQYADRLAEADTDVHAMISVETIGYYSDEKKSQPYPFPFSLFYPSTGNFIGFVGNGRSSRVTRSAIRTFREEAAFPSQGVASPRAVPGVSWSDHWAFWEHGYDAFMVTDTAVYRYPHYHRRSDKPHHLDYERMARVVSGLVPVIEALATE